MLAKERNGAYIDGANLHNGIKAQGWILDYAKLRVLLREKHSVTDAFLFMGLIPKYGEMYKNLQQAGYILVFKEVVYDGNGKPKGNCDADLVLQATRDHFENKYEKAVIVTSDGDYASLVKMLFERNALKVVLSPAVEEKCSILLKKIGAPITFLGQMKQLLHK